MSTNNDLNLGVTPLPVNNGGTGLATTTAYSVICAGTSSTGAFQSLSALGSSTTVLTSNGAAALPSFQTAPTAGTSPILYSKITLTPTDVIAMYVTPKLLISAGGAHTILIVNRATLELDYNSIAYTLGGTCSIQWDSTTLGAGTLAAPNLGSTTFMQGTADQTISRVGVATSTSNPSASTTVNKGLYLSNITAAYATGDSNLYVHLYYVQLATTI